MKTEKEKERDKQWYLKNKERILKKRKEYYAKNYIDILLKNKKRYIKNKDKISEWGKLYRKNNTKEIKERKKLYRIKNREEILKRKKLYYKNNLEKIKEYNRKEETKKRLKIWREKNPIYKKEYIKKYCQKHKKEHALYCRNRRRTDLKVNLNHKISGQIWKSLRRNKNGWHWEDLVGYTLNDLIKRLKETMPEGYTWDDVLEGKLHIDHIIPISAWDFDKPEQINFQKCWALSNLQLLPAKENMIKHDKLIRTFQLALKI